MRLDAVGRYLRYLADRFPRPPGAPVDKRHYATIGGMHLRLTRESADGYGDYYRLVLWRDGGRLSDADVARVALSFFPDGVTKIIKPKKRPNEVHVFARCGVQDSWLGKGVI